MAISSIPGWTAWCSLAFTGGREPPFIGETNIEPIKNPVTGEEHRARIVLPDGFEYKEAEMGNTVN